MPQRKDPDIPVKQAMVVIPWPGANAERVEELVTRTVEKTIASNANVARIESVSRSNVSVITFTLSEDLTETGQVLDDIAGRLAAVRDLPEGAGPIDYRRDFGDTATLMLTVASPKADTSEIAVRAEAVRKAIEAVRPAGKQRASVVFCFPPKVDRRLMRLGAHELAGYLRAHDAARDLHVLEGPGFIGLDLETQLPDDRILGFLRSFLAERYRESELHPDLWRPFVVREPAGTQARLAAVAGDKYSYRELEEFTDTMEKALLATARQGEGTPLVAKVSRSGILPEQVCLFYSIVA
jgi:hypothetical protein